MKLQHRLEVIRHSPSTWNTSHQGLEASSIVCSLNASLLDRFKLLFTASTSTARTTLQSTRVRRGRGSDPLICIAEGDRSSRETLSRTSLSKGKKWSVAPASPRSHPTQSVNLKHIPSRSRSLVNRLRSQCVAPRPLQVTFHCVDVYGECREQIGE
jgi:hypothetical protein